LSSKNSLRTLEGKVPIIAPEGFMEEAVSENIIAGTAMRRRAGYMYGSHLPKGPKGTVGVGLGTFVPMGTVTLIPPTDHIKKTGETRVVDGIEIEFMMANGAEAPVEMMFYFPKFKAICQAEICSCLMHNVYTLRGAKLRDATQWSTCINEAMLRFGAQSEVSFGSHNWPRLAIGEAQHQDTHEGSA
jgi:alkyl sulfatase BDS1-like metallo-beta-lactamase superfamily hydrolase